MRGIALGVLLGVSAFAQPQKGEHSVNGTVMNAVSGEPIRNALVALLKMPSGNESSGPSDAGVEEPRTKATLSGPGGEFHFEGLPEGLYAYMAQKPGFTRDQNAAGTLVIRASGDAPMVLKLTPLGAIEGKV